MSFNADLKKILLKHKNKNAFIDVYNGRKTTYSELYQNLNKIINYLKYKNVKPKDEVASVLENSSENFQFFLASCFLGLKYFPQSCEITVYEVQKLLKETNIKIFFISKNTNFKIKQCLKKNKIKIIDIDNYNLKQKLNFKKIFLKNYSNFSNLVVNSSGTTGEPKKILIDINRLWASAKNFTKNYKFLNSKNIFYNILPMSYLGGLFNLGLIPLSLGATIIIDKQFSGNTFLNFWNKIKQYNIDILWLVPTILRGLIKLSKNIKMNYKNYNVLPRACFLGTATSFSGEKKIFEKKFKIPIFENYGTSETTFVSIETNKSKKIKKKNVGEIIKNISCLVKNKTLHVKSPYNFLGYYNKNKTDRNRNYYDTGDICEIFKNKYLDFKGRKREIIKKGGLLLALKEIQETFQSNILVEECYCLPIKHEFYGEDYIIFFTSRYKSKIEKIKILFREKVPRYKWPKDIINIKKFKKTASGKIDIRSLKKINYEK